MNLLFYNLGIQLYRIAILLASPFNKKARLWQSGRQDYFSNLQRKLNKNSSPLIWFHAASLGEFEQCRPIIEKIKKELPEYGVLITFFSPSGYEIRKNYEQADYIFYLPLDTSFNAKKFIRVTNPRLALFAKYEFWYHFLNELKNKNIPVLCFSSIFRKEQIFFKPYGRFFQNILHKFDKIFVQDSESERLLNQIKINTVEIAGDTRFDRVAEICNQAKSLPLIEKFKGNGELFIAGSTWDADLEIILPFINNPEIKIKTIIAPHELSEKEILSIESKIQKPSIRYSEAAASESNLLKAEVLIIDNIGMLSSLYKYGYFAYVGGAFGKGLHNILEPACFGLPVFFGPKYQKFKEAVDLVESGGAFSISSSEEFLTKAFNLLNTPQKKQTLSDIIKSYVNQHTGASQKIFNYCLSLLQNER